MLSSTEQKERHWLEQRLLDEAESKIVDLAESGEMLDEFAGAAKLLRYFKTLFLVISGLGLIFCAWTSFTHAYFNPNHLSFHTILDKNWTLLQQVNYINVPTAAVAVGLSALIYRFFLKRDEKLIELYETRKIRPCKTSPVKRVDHKNEEKKTIKQPINFSKNNTPRSSSNSDQDIMLINEIDLKEDKDNQN